jgi:hypothetical protein
MAGEWFKLSDKQRNALLSVTAFQEGGFIVAGEGVVSTVLLQP